MSIKTRYALSSFLKLFFIVSASFLLLFFLIDILESMADVIRRGETFQFRASLYRLPSIFVEISPVLTFLSGMFLLGEMIKYGEVRVLEISGIKPLKILLVLFMCGFFISGISFHVKNYIAPGFLSRLDRTEEIEMLNFSTHEYFIYSQRFLPPDKFERVQFSHVRSDGSIISINALEAHFLGEGIWRFDSGTLWVFDRQGNVQTTERFSERKQSIGVHPDIIANTARNMDELSFSEMLVLARKLREANLLSFAMQASLHERFAYPLLNLFLLFVLFPFFYIKHRISRVFVLGLSIFLSFICYGIFSSGLTLARAGKINTVMGVWLVHILISSAVTMYFLSQLPKKAKSYII